MQDSSGWSLLSEPGVRFERRLSHSQSRRLASAALLLVMYLSDFHMDFGLQDAMQYPNVWQTADFLCLYHLSRIAVFFASLHQLVSFDTCKMCDR